MKARINMSKVNRIKTMIFILEGEKRLAYYLSGVGCKQRSVSVVQQNLKTAHCFMLSFIMIKGSQCLNNFPPQ
jgi:hypothetical protein